jgi:hypothetical protein
MSPLINNDDGLFFASLHVNNKGKKRKKGLADFVFVHQLLLCFGFGLVL